MLEVSGITSKYEKNHDPIKANATCLIDLNGARISFTVWLIGDVSGVHAGAHVPLRSAVHPLGAQFTKPAVKPFFATGLVIGCWGTLLMGGDLVSPQTWEAEGPKENQSKLHCLQKST